MELFGMMQVREKYVIDQFKKLHSDRSYSVAAFILLRLVYYLRLPDSSLCQ